MDKDKKSTTSSLSEVVIVREWIQASEIILRQETRRFQFKAKACMQPKHHRTQLFWARLLLGQLSVWMQEDKVSSHMHKLIKVAQILGNKSSNWIQKVTKYSTSWGHQVKMQKCYGSQTWLQMQVKNRKLFRKLLQRPIYPSVASPSSLMLKPVEVQMSHLLTFAR